MTGPLAAGDATVSTSRARVVIADDDVLLREGLASLLERSGSRSSARPAMAPAARPSSASTVPTSSIVDIRMPPDAHHRRARGGAHDPRGAARISAILVLSAHVEVEQATELLASGQRIGYLLKSRVTDVDEFIDTFERIVTGGSRRRSRRSSRSSSRRGASTTRSTSSSPREREVLALMAEGRSNAGIAPPALGDRGHGREARPQHPDEARPAGDAGRPPTRARGAHRSSTGADPRWGEGYRLAGNGIARLARPAN